MHDPQLVVFLLALGMLFASAKLMGAAASRLGCPAIVGEILAGVVVGKTVLGRYAPGAFAWLFGNSGANTMLQGYKLVAVVLLLATAGLEINLGLLRRRSRTLLLTGVFGAIVPFAMGYGTGLVLPPAYLEDPSRRGLHALFLGIALAISALPVITRTLMDLGLLASELGMLVLSAAVFDDLVGWIGFSALVRELRAGSDGHGGSVVMSIALTGGFMAVALVTLRPVVDRWLRASARVARDGASTASALSMIVILTMLGATATELLGIHAVFGGFVVGLAIGRSPHLRPETRDVLRDCVTSLFTPIFFATMALRYDFVRSFDVGLVAIVLVVATVAKVAGCSLGAWLSGMGRREALAVGFGLNSRGAMEILLASIALEAKMITEQMFVALVVMAIVTSLVSGPALLRLLRAPPAPPGTIPVTDSLAVVAESVRSQT